LEEITGDLPEEDFWTASQNCSQVPSERTQLAEYLPSNGQLASDRGKLVFDKTPPATIDRYNRSKLFLAWDGDRSILRSFCLSCWFEPYPHVINSIMQDQEADPN
jgi:hypothetical protein